MTLRFIHTADLHIGARRLENPALSGDFSAGWNQAVDLALAEKADAVVIAGDLFDRARIDPTQLENVEPGLIRLREAGVVVLAVEGNHDTLTESPDFRSWLSYLAGQGLLTLLKIPFVQGKPIIEPVDPATNRGGYAVVNGVTVYGLGYLGASTARRLEVLAPLLKDNCLLVVHAGLQGIAAEFGGLSREELAPLKGKVAYLALGHNHHRHVVDDFAFVPGAPENWRFEEGLRGKKGFFVVCLEPDGTKEHRFVPSQPRPTVLIKLGPGEGSDLFQEGDPDWLADRMVEQARQVEVPTGAIVRVELAGRVGFHPLALDATALGRRLEEIFRPAGLEVRNQLTERTDDEAAEQKPLDRAGMERQETAALLGREADDPLVELSLAVKERLLADRSPEELADIFLAAALEIEADR